MECRSRLATVLFSLIACVPFLLGASARAAGFESQFYYSLDLQRAAKDQYGPSATLTWVGDHLYDWRAVVRGQFKSLDLKLAVKTQYGSSWTLAAVGVHRYDWRAVKFANLSYVVLPVMLIASDRWFDINGVRDGLARFQSVLLADQNWYQLRAGATFRLLQPLVVYTSLSAADWKHLSDISADPAHRYDMLYAGKDQYTYSLPAAGSSLRVAMSPYAGPCPDVSLGAASTASYALAPQRATSLVCPPSGPLDYRCADATYAIGHELGHTFGLNHSCDDYPSDGQCQNSIMQVGKPWDAILLKPEIAKLLNSPFFD
ncbi:MAG: hypothetical protein U1E76_05300 [Planctomycetota bacterium]